MVFTYRLLASSNSLDHPTPGVSRDLTLVAKILQNLANLMTFGKKETCMAIFNEWLEKQQPKMKKFLDDISSLPTSRMLYIFFPYRSFSHGSPINLFLAVNEIPS